MQTLTISVKIYYKGKFSLLSLKIKAQNGDHHGNPPLRPMGNKTHCVLIGQKEKHGGQGVVYSR